MSTKRSCTACDDLRTYAPGLMVNGLDDNNCTSLQNDTGLVASNGHNDCQDLNDMNDCLVGDMKTEVDKYNICDWKKFAKEFIPNLWTTLKGIICAICGIWIRIWNHEARISKNECLIGNLYGGINITFGEDSFIEGTGISFYRPDPASVDLSCMIKGNIARFHGSITVDLSGNHWGKLGLKNSGSATSGNRINTSDENWTIAILKINKAQYPMIKKVWSDAGSFVNAACGQIRVRGHDEGTTYPGQWGNDSQEQTVPAGWYYVRVDLSNLVTWGIAENQSNARVTFDCLNMVDISQEAIC